MKAGSVIPMVRNLGLFFIVLCLIFLAMIAGQFPDREDPYIPALSSKYYYEKGRTIIQDLSSLAGTQFLKAILRTELPVLSVADEEGYGQPTSGRSLVKLCLNMVSGIRLEDPLSYLKSEIPMMDVTPVTADSFDEIGTDEITEPSPIEPSGPVSSQPTVENSVKSDIPLIALYNTHNSETFELTDGLTHLKGKAGGVAIVAAEIVKTIEEQYGIAAEYCPTIHDMAFNRSYAESEKTVSRLVKDNPKLEMLFDIHRDGSLSREQSLVEINGQKLAKILFVVGTDARADHPKWRENLEFARKISAKMDDMYPGLSRGIAIKQGRYNQQFSPRALLVEIGSAQNTTDEAVASGRLFANVVVAVLNDLRTGKQTN